MFSRRRAADHAKAKAKLEAAKKIEVSAAEQAVSEKIHEEEPQKPAPKSGGNKGKGK